MTFTIYTKPTDILREYLCKENIKAPLEWQGLHTTIIYSKSNVKVPVLKEIIENIAKETRPFHSFITGIETLGIANEKHKVLTLEDEILLEIQKNIIKELENNWRKLREDENSKLNISLKNDYMPHITVNKFPKDYTKLPVVVFREICYAVKNENDEWDNITSFQLGQ